MSSSEPGPGTNGVFGPGTSTNVKTAALDYASRGWPVFPVEPGGKRPLGRLVPHGLKDATTDAEVVEGWWNKVPEANVGLVTGVTFDVFDVDTDGWPSVAGLTVEHGPMTLGPVAMTPGGGVHDLFMPTGLGNRAGFLPGCDWRGAGGYIVAPPSLHPNGGTYEWAIAPDDPELPLVEAPAWLVKHLTKSQDSAGPVRHSATGASTPYGQAALEREVGKIAMAPEGSRNHALNRASFALAQLVAAGQLEVDEMVDALRLAALRSGLSETETDATIRSGFAAGVRQPRVLK